MRLALFNTSAPERKHGGVAAIVQDHVAGLVARTPIEDALYIIPIFLKGLTLYGENGNALSRNGSGGVVLGRENITRCPTNLSAQCHKRFDQHGSLDRHVQRSPTARALQRPRHPL